MHLTMNHLKLTVLESQRWSECPEDPLSLAVAAALGYASAPLGDPESTAGRLFECLSGVG